MSDCNKCMNVRVIPPDGECDSAMNVKVCNLIPSNLDCDVAFLQSADEFAAWKAKDGYGFAIAYDEDGGTCAFIFRILNYALATPQTVTVKIADVPAPGDPGDWTWPE